MFKAITSEFIFYHETFVEHLKDLVKCCLFLKKLSCCQIVISDQMKKDTANVFKISFADCVSSKSHPILLIIIFFIKFVIEQDFET